MKLGIWGARADRRGLAIQSGAAAQWLDPVKVVGFEMGEFTPYESVWTDYDPRTLRVLPFDPVGCANAELESFCEGLDVLLAFETPYDYRIYDIARQMGVRSVLQFNFEFFRHHVEPDLPRPDLLLASSTWRLDHVPEALLWEFPVDRDKLPFTERTQASTFLHVGGHPTRADRNGTKALYRALPYVRSQVTVIVRTQARGFSEGRSIPRNVDLVHECADIEDYRALYVGADALIMPRRYGGQSLVLNEACSLGLPIIATDVEPQNSWLHPSGRIRAMSRRSLRVQSGTVPMHEPDPRSLARAIDNLAGDPAAVQASSWASDARAQALDWQVQRPALHTILERLLDRQPAR